MDLPIQMRLVTGATFLGFVDDTSAFWVITAGCVVSYNRQTGSYDISDLMDAMRESDVNPDNIMCMQEVDLQSSLATVYPVFLHTLVIRYKEAGLEVPKVITEYLEYVTPEYMKGSDGVSPALYGELSYAEGMGDTARAESVRKKISDIIDGKSVKSNCEGNVISVNFPLKNSGTSETSEE